MESPSSFFSLLHYYPDRRWDLLALNLGGKQKKGSGMHLRGVLLACRAMIYSGRSLHRVPSRWWSRCFRSDCQYENFSFFKKGLAGWIIHTIVSAKLFLSCAGALSCRCSVSQSTFPGHFPPHIYHLKATERVKKTKPFFPFFLFI